MLGVIFRFKQKVLQAVRLEGLYSLDTLTLFNWLKATKKDYY